VPLVARMPIGIWSASAAQHSQSLEAWFAHLPGLVVAVPATPQDNFSLLKASLASGDPVIYMEHKELWGQTGPVDTSLDLPLGRANVMHEGSDLTIVTWSRGVAPTLQALAHEALQGASVEVIDLRTLWPWDQATVHASAAKTGRLLVVHEAVQVAGFGGEIAAHTAEATGCRVARLGSPRIPVGYAQVLENEARLSPEKIAHAAKALLERA
jgi:pyruvate dehydrogenase E1 component beta subunit